MPDVLQTRSAFAGLIAGPGSGPGSGPGPEPGPARAGTGVFVAERDGVGIASVLTRKGQSSTLAARVRERYGIDLPDGPRRVGSGDVAFIGTGPGAWLAIGDGGNAFAASVRDALAGAASVSDQSDGYGVLRLTGPRIGDTLAKLVSIDLHPAAFAPNAAAVTLAGHIGVTLWRLDDADNGPVFELAVYRSMARSLWHALDESAAEFGMRVAG